MLHVEQCQTLTFSAWQAGDVGGEEIRSVVKYYLYPQEGDLNWVEGGREEAAMLKWLPKCWSMRENQRSLITMVVFMRHHFHTTKSRTELRRDYETLTCST